MPTYCYTTRNGSNTVDRYFPFGMAPKKIRVGGRVADRDVVAEHSSTSSTPGNWPMESDAAGVCPTQIDEVQRHSMKIGVPTQFNRKTGAAIFRTRRHRKKYLEAIGMFDRDGGHSDPQRK